MIKVDFCKTKNRKHEIKTVKINSICIHEHFENKMKEIRNNCLGKRKLNITLCQVKMGKHRCLMKGPVKDSLIETNAASFLHLIVIIYKVIINRFSTGQLVCFLLQ